MAEEDIVKFVAKESMRVIECITNNLIDSASKFLLENERTRTISDEIEYGTQAQQKMIKLFSDYLVSVCERLGVEKSKGVIGDCKLAPLIDPKTNAEEATEVIRNNFQIIMQRSGETAGKVVASKLGELAAIELKKDRSAPQTERMITIHSFITSAATKMITDLESPKRHGWKCLGCDKETMDFKTPDDWHLICDCHFHQYVCASCFDKKTKTEDEWCEVFGPEHSVRVKGQALSKGMMELMQLLAKDELPTESGRHFQVANVNGVNVIFPGTRKLD